MWLQLESFVASIPGAPAQAARPQPPHSGESGTADDEPDVSLSVAFWGLFMGTSPDWYKQAVVGALVLNIFVRFGVSAPACAWCVLLEFIGTLAMATHCYPLQPGTHTSPHHQLDDAKPERLLAFTGGLIVMQAYALQLAPASRLEHEVEVRTQPNLPPASPQCTAGRVFRTLILGLFRQMNIDILLLVTFMVACIHFLKNLLLWIFTV